MKVIGIVGTRKRTSKKDYDQIREWLFNDAYDEGDMLCSGGCPLGADKFAHRIAKEVGIPIIIYYPDWKKYGKGAGMVRNTKIAEHSDILIACVTKDRTGGTEDTIKKFKKLGKDTGDNLIILGEE